MLVKCPGIFLKNFKTTENWVMMFVLIPLEMTINKKEPGDKVKLIFLFCFVFAKFFIHYPKWSHRYHRERPEHRWLLTHLSPCHPSLYLPSCMDLEELAMNKAYVDVNMRSLRSLT